MIPGVMGHICSILGENDVNIIETSSCWTDTIIVIKKEHLAKTIGNNMFALYGSCEAPVVRGGLRQGP